MNKISIRLISFITITWFCLFPVVEIGISKLISLSDSDSIMTAIESGDERKYKNMDVDEIISDIPELFKKEVSINEKLQKTLDTDALLELNFEKNIEILGLFFIDGYAIDGKSFPLYEYNDEVKKEREKFKKAIRLLKNPDNFDLIDKGIRYRESIFSDIEKTITYNFKDVKIELINEDLTNKIKALHYKKYIESVSPYYGFAFLAFFVLMFTAYTSLIEVQYINANVSKFLESEYETLREKSATMVQPFTSLKIILIGALLLLTMGLMLSIIPLYFSEMSQASSIPFVHNLITPFVQIFHYIGNFYLQNIPLSRFFLVILMPISVVIYMRKISKMENLIKEINSK